MDTLLLPTMKPNYVFLILVVCCILSLVSQAANVAAPAASNGFRVRAVNLGGWLVTEGWIKPSLFDAIPNKDLTDGTMVQFKSVTVGKYLSTESSGGTILLVANKTVSSKLTTFRLWRINETTFNFRASNNQFVGLDMSNGGAGVNLVAVESTPGISETFVILRNSDDPNRVRIKSSNGFFLQVRTEELVTADSKENEGWSDDDPSIFIMTIFGGFQGEFQVTNGYGPLMAPKVMKEHWETFIVEEDFKWISKNGLNAVRIPVGWWIARDPNPPKPFVGGSLKALDNAFLWAVKYGLKVIIDLHSAPRCQNGLAVGATRDGSLEWGIDSVDQTVDVIDFLTARYAENPSLYAVQLMNEPVLWNSVETLMLYYQRGYEAVRKHSSTAYVVMSVRMGVPNVTELLPFAAGYERSVIDVHLYNMVYWTVQETIDFLNTYSKDMLSAVTTSNGPLSFVGEWVTEWLVPNATKEEYQRFAKAQLEVFDGATFGWAYWTLKNVINHWSLEWMINNGYINLTTTSNSISDDHLYVS
nr:glucan 1,3-beta-glucosidase A-like [Ipomoea trifida]